MTKEEWEKVEESLFGCFTKVVLLIDDFEVTVVVEPYTALKNVFVVYVNGAWKGKWLSEDCEERRRFYQKHTKNMLSRKDQKRLAREKKAIRDAVGKTTFDWYAPYWTSFKSMKAHFIKNNKSIELVKIN